MTTVAVTNHAVDRYKERVSGSEKLSDDAIRNLIRGIIDDAFANGAVQEHPGHADRRIIPFQTSKEVMYLALGPNTTSYPGDWAVIGTLNDREMGRTSVGATLGDVFPEALKTQIAAAGKFEPPKAKYLVRIRAPNSKERGEVYEAKDDEDLEALLSRRSPDPDFVEVFERKPITIKRVYVVEKSK